jgi:glutamate synthase domain-containing protein 2
MIRLAFTLRFIVYTLSTLLTAALLLTVLAYPAAIDLAAVPLAVFAGFTVLGTRDLIQTRHAVLRNYPISAHLRFLLEQIRPEMRQYFFEDEKDGRPFSRDKRAVAYQRAKMVLDKRPFGTQYDVYAEGFEWVRHSIMPRPLAAAPFRISIGGPDCARPYDASIFNISAMSFGALSANAIRALNKGAKAGRFAHDTGEGGLSPYHRENGGDIIWEIGSGYFGARNPDGSFSAERFAETAALDQVKMVELKISQGAKPGHGGVLPAAKVSAEIARTRGVSMGQDCVSPSGHSRFSTVVEDKWVRVKNFHAATLHALSELVAAAGLNHPSEFMLAHFSRRVSPREVVSFDELYPALRPGELVDGTDDPRFRDPWKMASAGSFRPVS